MVTSPPQTEYSRYIGLEKSVKITGVYVAFQTMRNTLQSFQKEKSTDMQFCWIRMDSSQRLLKTLCKFFSKVLCLRTYPTERGHMEDAASITDDYPHHTLKAMINLKNKKIHLNSFIHLKIGLTLALVISYL